MLAAALVLLGRDGKMMAYLALVLESGRSSYMYLQNAYTCQNPAEQGIPGA